MNKRIAAIQLKTFRLVVFALIVLLVGTGLSRTTAASTGEGFSLSPLSFETVLEPGGQETVKMQIRNVGSGVLRLRMYACDVLSAQPGEGAVKYVGVDEKEASASRWFSISPTTVTLNAGEEQTVYVDLIVPANATGGTYRGVVFGETVPDVQGAAQVGNRIGMLTFVSVGKEADFSVEVLDVRVKNWWGSNPYFDVTVSNNGSIHQSLTGQMQIWHKGEMAAELESAKVVLQPQEVRSINVYWPNAPRLGSFQTSINFNEGLHQQRQDLYSFILFPVVSAVGFLLLVISVHLFRNTRKDPLQRIKKPGS